MPLPYSTPYASPQPIPPSSPLYTQVLSDLNAAPHSPIPPYPAQAYHNYQPPQPIWPSQRQPSEGLYNSSTESHIATSSPTIHSSQPPTLSNTSMVHFPVTVDRARSPYAARPLPRFGVSTMPWHPDPPEASLHPRQLPPNSFASHSIAAAAAGYVRDASHPPHPTDISPSLVPANNDHVATNSSPYSVPTTIHFDAAHYDSSGYRHAPAMSSSDAAIASSSPLASPILADGLHPHRQGPTAPSMSTHIDTAGHGAHNGLSVNVNAHPLAVEWNTNGHSHGNTTRAVVYGGGGGDDVTTDPDVGADADADAEGEDDCDIDVDLDATVLPSKPISNGVPSGFPADSSMVYLDATHTHFDEERREYIEYHENQSQSQSHAYVVSPASAPGSESILRLRAPAAPNVRYTPYPAYAGPPPPSSSHVHPDVYNTLADQQHHHHRYHNHDIDIPVHPHRQLQQQQYHYDYSDSDEVDAQGIRTRKVSSTSTAGSSSSHSSASTSTSATSILPLTPTSPFSSPIGVNYLPGVGGAGCYGGSGNSAHHSHAHGVGVLPTPSVSVSHNRISNQTFNSTSNPLVNVNTNSSGSGPVELKRRTRQSTPLPVPIPIPNLTKKSRGRRVPTLSNWDHLQQRGHLGGSERDDEDLDGNLVGDAVGGGSARRGSMSAGGGAASGGGERSGSGRGKAGGARMFTCVVDGCGKCFARGEHLKRHVRSIHTYDKPHKCPYPGCGKDFSRHDNLGQHMRVHKDYVPPPKNAGSSSAGFSGYREVHHP